MHRIIGDRAILFINGHQFTRFPNARKLAQGGMGFSMRLLDSRTVMNLGFVYRLKRPQDR